MSFCQQTGFTAGLLAVKVIGTQLSVDLPTSDSIIT